MKTVRDFNVKGKKVLVRCDFNVPLNEKKEILDDFRIRKTIPTIEYLIKNGAKIILISHLGRPVSNESQISEYSLRPVVLKLEQLLNQGVEFLDDCVGEKVESKVEEIKPGGIVLLENLRFHKEEKENNFKFAKSLAELGDIFINDAFGVSHRVHASIVGIPKFLPSGIGFLFEKEIKSLDKIIKNPEKPLIAIIGGKKVETKAGVINKISEIADFILIGHLIQKEISEKKITIIHSLKILKPIDNSNKDNNSFDIGPKTINLFKEKIKGAKTIFWSGPLGKIEEKNFQTGSREIAKAIIESGAFSVVGGGETVEFLNEIKMTEKFNHVSTGGGAMLQYLAGEELPGLKALE